MNLIQKEIKKEEQLKGALIELEKFNFSFSMNRFLFQHMNGIIFE